MDSAWPQSRKPPAKRGSRLDPYHPVIDGWLRDDLDAPRKQRHTAKRIFDRLLDEREANCPRHETPGQRQYLKIKVEITAAIVDRLTFGGTILETGTDSYRLAHATKQLTG